jgi:hypothetical protein
MRIIIAGLIILFCSCKSTQGIQIAPTSKTISLDTNSDSLFFALQKQYDIALSTGYQKGSSDGLNYIIIAMKNKQWVKINYSIPIAIPVGKVPYTMTTTKLKRELGDSVLKVFIDNSISKIQDLDADGCDPSELPKLEGNKNFGCTVHDASTNQIIIITKTGFSEKLYYAAEYSNKCCPGNKDRNAFVNCWNAIRSLK